MRINGKEVSVNPQESSKLQSMEHTERTIDKGLRVCSISTKMIEALVQQLGCELSNYHMYKTFADYFRTEGLHKLEEYYNLRAQEENTHHNWIANYLRYSDADFTYPRVEAINLNITDRLYPFKATVDREIDTTLAIYKLVELAKEEKDWISFAWLMGNDKHLGALVLEQNEEMSISRHILRIASEDADWIAKQDTILEFYNK